MRFFIIWRYRNRPYFTNYFYVIRLLLYSYIVGLVVHWSALSYAWVLCNATHDVAMVILSVCLAVRPSFTRVYCDKTNMTHCRYFDTTRNGNYSSFLMPTLVGGRCPFPVKYSPKGTHRHAKLIVPCNQYFMHSCRWRFDNVILA